VSVYLINNGKLDLLSKEQTEMERGVFLSDEKYIYITDSPRKLVRFDVQRATGRCERPHLRVTNIGGRYRGSPGSPDGLKTREKRRQSLHGRSGGIVSLSSDHTHYRPISKPQEDYEKREESIPKGRGKGGEKGAFLSV